MYQIIGHGTLRNGSLQPSALSGSRLADSGGDTASGIDLNLEYLEQVI
jgi:hypothetical protein